MGNSRIRVAHEDVFLLRKVFVSTCVFFFKSGNSLPAGIWASNKLCGGSSRSRKDGFGLGTCGAPLRPE